MIKRHPFPLLTVAWSPEGSRIASAGISHEVWIWDATDGRMLTILRQQRAGVNMVAWSPDGTRLAAAGKKGGIHLWEVSTGNALLTLGTPHQEVHVLAWSPDGVTLASSSDDGTIHCWNSASGEKSLTLHQGHIQGWAEISALGWSPNGRYLASSGQSPDLCIWDVTTGELADWLSDTDCYLIHAFWKSHGERLIGSYYGAPFAFLKGSRVFDHSHARSALPITCSPDARYFAGAQWGKAVTIWQVGAGIFGETLFRYSGHTQIVTALEWSPDGTRIASASQDRTVQVWEPEMAKHPLASTSPTA